jgi:hypothetical protein
MPAAGRLFRAIESLLWPVVLHPIEWNFGEAAGAFAAHAIATKQTPQWIRESSKQPAET